MLRYSGDKLCLERIQRQNVDVNKKHKIIMILYIIQCAFILGLLPLLSQGYNSQNEGKKHAYIVNLSLLIFAFILFRVLNIFDFDQFF